MTWITPLWQTSSRTIVRALFSWDSWSTHHDNHPHQHALHIYWRTMLYLVSRAVTAEVLIVRCRQLSRRSTMWLPNVSAVGCHRPTVACSVPSALLVLSVLTAVSTCMPDLHICASCTCWQTCRQTPSSVVATSGEFVSAIRWWGHDNLGLGGLTSAIFDLDLSVLGFESLTFVSRWPGRIFGPQVDGAHIWDPDVLWPLWLHATRTLETGTQMRM